MASNSFTHLTRIASVAACVLSLLALTACSVSGPRESPLNEVTAGSPTVSEVFRGTDGAQLAARETFHDFEMQRRSADGSLVWVSVSVPSETCTVTS